MKTRSLVLLSEIDRHPRVQCSVAYTILPPSRLTVFSTANALLARHVPQDRRATAYGLFDALRGTAWLLGSAALGVLYTVGPPALVGISLMLQLAAIPVLTSMSPGSR